MKKLKCSKEQTDKKEKSKEKKITVNYKKYIVVFLWLLLISSFIFAVYKNFTAIDMHTVHEREIVEEKVVNTNKLENFVLEFAEVYYSWGNTQQSLDTRNSRLTAYMTPDLVTFNNGVIRADIPTVSSVVGSKVWNIEKVAHEDYFVLFSIVQRITEGEKTSNVKSVYETRVHLDDSGNMVIIKNPTVSYLPEKSNYVPIPVEYDSTVDMGTTNEINLFLETFFKLYPKATEHEISFYVKDGFLKGIDDRYIFSELTNTVCKRENEGQIRVNTNVVYLDGQTKATQISQFELLLQKTDGNWKIIGVYR